MVTVSPKSENKPKVIFIAVESRIFEPPKETKIWFEKSIIIIIIIIEVIHSCPRRLQFLVLTKRTVVGEGIESSL